MVIRFKLVLGHLCGKIKGLCMSEKTCWPWHAVDQNMAKQFRESLLADLYILYLYVFYVMQVPRSSLNTANNIQYIIVFRYPDKIYISWRFWLLCEWKIIFEIGSLRCVEYIEKKPNFPILTSLKFQIFFINHGSQHSTPFQKSF